MDYAVNPQNAPLLNLETGSATNCPAPAKLNLFLHVTGRRADGYHLLDTAFQLIDRCDLLHFQLRDDHQIQRQNDVPGVPADSDLVIRAARLLQSQINSKQGVDITLEKHLPMGGGVGGGSSDAATTLIALNRLWGCNLSRQQLMELSVQLGADVPFFLFGQNAFAQGIGEQLTALDTPQCWYVIIEPGVHVPTPAIFSSKALTRNSPSITVSDFRGYPQGDFRNDLQDVAVQLFPEVSFALEWLNKFGNLVGNSGKAKMTGSGACVFCPCDSEVVADKILGDISGFAEANEKHSPQKWKAWKARSLTEHPLKHWTTP